MVGRSGGQKVRLLNSFVTVVGGCMARARLSVFSYVASMGLVLCAVGTAAAQTTTINQTSCINGTGTCTTGGLLETVALDCSLAGSAGKISTALSSLHDRSGPNLITVTGTCSAEIVNVTG